MVRYPGPCDRSALISIKNTDEGNYFLGKLRETDRSIEKFWIGDLLKYSSEELDPNCEDSQKHWKNVRQEECLSYSLNGTIQKENCWSKLPYICSMPENYYSCSGRNKNAVENSVWLYSFQTKHCYMANIPDYRSSNPTFDQWSNFCGEFDASLASIHSELEEEIIHDVFDGYIDVLAESFAEFDDQYKAIIIKYALSEYALFGLFEQIHASLRACPLLGI
uniref:C-type lectin domain-containing protein n=1 Tax=Acrobeloides nanus TaxID=290746 RepID=A0A914BW57_9BILA